MVELKLEKLVIVGFSGSVIFNEVKIDAINKVAATTNNPKRSASKPSVELENKIKMDVPKAKTKPKILFFVALFIKNNSNYKRKNG